MGNGEWFVEVIKALIYMNVVQIIFRRHAKPFPEVKATIPNIN